MRKLPILILLFCVLMPAAASAYGSEVTADSGDSNIRSAPNLDADTIGVLHRGESAEYAGETSTDDRGVDWYSIDHYGETGWVSSRYTVLMMEGEAVIEEKDADDQTVAGEYRGLYGLSAEISGSPSRIHVFDPDGTLLLSCDYAPKRDNEGFTYVNTNTAYTFFPRECNGSEAIIVYKDSEFVDMLVLYGNE